MLSILFGRWSRVFVHIVPDELHTCVRREHAQQIIVMDVHILLAGAKGEEAGEVPLASQFNEVLV